MIALAVILAVTVASLAVTFTAVWAFSWLRVHKAQRAAEIASARKQLADIAIAVRRHVVDPENHAARSLHEILCLIASASSVQGKYYSWKDFFKSLRHSKGQAGAQEAVGLVFGGLLKNEDKKLSSLTARFIVSYRNALANRHPYLFLAMVTKGKLLGERISHPPLRPVKKKIEPPSPYEVSITEVAATAQAEKFTNRMITC